MLVNGKPYRTIWENPKDEQEIFIIDQRLLPHKFETVKLKNLEDFLFAINDMLVRGAPLIGVTAAYGLYSASLSIERNFKKYIEKAAQKLIETRPTAVNLKWAVEQQLSVVDKTKNIHEARQALLTNARFLAEEDIRQNKQIGIQGVKLIEKIYLQKDSQPVNILTHCNAGWLATVDIGTATAPIYEAHSKGLSVHVWVDETRPRNQGSKLTAWELLNQGVPHTIIADNAGGHLMQNGMVDLVIVGSDRTSANGDVANKIGTYLKALAAKDNNIPFYVALPTSTIDLTIEDGMKDIPIEERNQDEVKYIEGLDGGKIRKILLTTAESKASNFGFDVTPSRLVTGIITEKGICKPNKISIFKLLKGL